jgi:hypothetical protein
MDAPSPPPDYCSIVNAPERRAGAGVVPATTNMSGAA